MVHGPMRTTLGLSDDLIAAVVLARQDCLVTFGRDFVPLQPPRRLVLLES